jgi:hypothetical protein
MSTLQVSSRYLDARQIPDQCSSLLGQLELDPKACPAYPPGPGSRLASEEHCPGPLTLMW